MSLWSGGRRLGLGGFVRDTASLAVGQVRLKVRTVFEYIVGDIAWYLSLFERRATHQGHCDCRDSDE